MAIPAPLDPSAYTWQQHAESSYRRLPLSSESLWFSRPRDARHIFITANVTLQRPWRILEILEVVREAWRRLSYGVPELRLSSVTENDEVYLQYECPKDDDEVKIWAKRTVHVESSDERPDFKRLRDLILEANGKCIYAASLLLYFQHEGEEQPEEICSGKFWCVLNTDHLITDGIGTRILLGKFLDAFSGILETGGPQVESVVYPWNQGWKNLSPPWICIMNDKQRLSGKDFEGRVASDLQYLTYIQSPDPGIPLSLPTVPPKESTQETYFFTLSPSNTTTLLNAIKTLPTTSPTNITSLAHAAMLLAILRLNPTHQQRFYSSCWLNGRRYLDSGDVGKEYVPVCMSFAPIVFDNLASLTVDEKASERELRRVLVVAVEQANVDYQKLRETESVLTEFAGVAELIGKNMRNKPPSAALSRLESAAPLFLSDGITEQYISHTYPVNSTFPTITVNDIHFAANAGEEIIIRMASFRGSARLSAEWKSDLFDGDIVRVFLEDIRSIMFSVLGEGGS